MKFAIALNTYKRPDGESFGYLTRAFQSIQKQTHQDFKLFFIGDKYEDEDEFNHFATSYFDKDKITSKNLPFAKEREKYPLYSRELWACGGVTSRNIAMYMAADEGYEYICHLDHDDYWEPDHLEQINNVIQVTGNPALVYTCANHVFLGVLPRHKNLDGGFEENIPPPGDSVHSSVCVNIKLLPFKYRDVFDLTGIADPADADMWKRVSTHIIDNNLKSYLIRKVTCHHPAEFDVGRPWYGQTPPGG